MQSGANQFGVDAQAFQTQQPIAVYGLRVANPRLATLTRRVLAVATISALLVIINTVSQGVMAPKVAANAWTVRLGGCALALIIPCCGYWGAKNSNKGLTCCFCGCNCLGSTLSILGCITIFLGYRFTENIVNHCHPGAPQSSHHTCPDMNQWDAICTLYGFPEHSVFNDPTAPHSPLQQCYGKIEDLEHSFKIAVFVQIGLSIPIILLQCLSFCWGNKLYRELKNGHVIHSAPQYTTNQVTVQPPQPQQTQIRLA